MPEKEVVTPDATPVVETPPEPEKTPPVEDPSDKLTPEHPRFKEIYGDLKSTQRELTSLKEQFAVAGTHNQELSEVIKNLNTTMVDARTADSSKIADDKIGVLQKDYTTALESEDSAKAQNIANQLIELRVKQGVEQELSSIKVEDPEPEKPASSRDAGYLDAMYELVISENEELLTNEPLRNMALALDAQFVNDPKWAGRPALSRIREAVKQAKELSSPKNTGSLTEGAGALTPSVNFDSITLTDIEKNASHNMAPALSHAEAETVYLKNKKEIATAQTQGATRQ